jgi:hypothetical protein
MLIRAEYHYFPGLVLAIQDEEPCLSIHMQSMARKDKEIGFAFSYPLTYHAD